jgi:hypothetical protein
MHGVTEAGKNADFNPGAALAKLGRESLTCGSDARGARQPGHVGYNDISIPSWHLTAPPFRLARSPGIGHHRAKK